MSLLRIWAIRVLSLAACAIAVYLFTQSSSDAGLVGCGEGCDAALSSRWAVWFGVPVSLFGAVAYMGVFASSLLVGRQNLTLDTLGWRGLELFVPLIVGAAVWFVGLQVSGATSFCPYCLAVHVCGVLIAVATVVHRRAALAVAPRTAPLAPGARAAAAVPAAPAGAAPPPSLGAPTLVGALGVGALLVGQLGFPPPSVHAQEVAEMDQSFDLSEADDDPAPPEPTNSPPEEAVENTTDAERIDAGLDDLVDLPPIEEPAPVRKANGSREVRLLKGQLKLDAYEHPIIGSPEAPWVIAELIDYTCPNCRKFHELSKEALKRYDGKLAIVIMPAPADGDCNKYIRTTKSGSRGGCELAKLSVGIARERPEDFAVYHDFLLTGEKPPSFSRARTEGQKYLEVSRLMQAMGSLRTKRYLDDYINLWAALARRNRVVLPCQFLGDNVVPGLPKDVDELCGIWEKYLGIEPVGEYARGTTLSGSGSLGDG